MSQIVDLFIGTGLQGTKGPPGPPGPVTVEIGDTVTGAPGTDATVTNVGTDENVVLNFIIPRGDPGPAGAVVQTEDPLQLATDTNTLFLNFATAAVSQINKSDLLIVQDAVSNLIKQVTLANFLRQNQFKDVWLTGLTKTVVHNLNTLDVTVQVYDLNTNANIIVGDVIRTSANSIFLSVPVAPTGNGYKILITAYF